METNNLQILLFDALAKIDLEIKYFVQKILINLKNPNIDIEGFENYLNMEFDVCDFNIKSTTRDLQWKCFEQLHRFVLYCKQYFNYYKFKYFSMNLALQKAMFIIKLQNLLMAMDDP